MASGASMLWRLARIVAGSRVAEEAVAQLIGLVKTRAAPSLPAGPGPDPTRLEMVEALVREHDDKLAAIAGGLEQLGTELRALVARAAVALWLSIAAVGLSLISLAVLLRR